MMKSSFNNENKYTKCTYGSICFYQINQEKMQISLIFRKGDNFFYGLKNYPKLQIDTFYKTIFNYS